LLIENIPDKLCSDVALFDYMVTLFGPESIDSVNVVRRTAKLCALIEKRDAIKSALKVALAQWVAEKKAPEKRAGIYLSGCLCFRQDSNDAEDTIRKHRERLKLCHYRVRKERQHVDEAAVLKFWDTAGGGGCSRTGFVTFTSHRACRLASREQFKPDVMVMLPSAPPSPEDVDYQHIGKDPLVVESQKWLWGLYLFLIMLLWLPIVASVAMLVNFREIEDRIPVIREFCNDTSTCPIVMQGLVSALLITMLVGAIPTTLMFGIKRFLASKSSVEAQLTLQSTYYVFQVVFILLVTAISSSFMTTLRSIANKPRIVFPLLARSLPSKSHWYSEFMALSWAADAFKMFRFQNLLAFTAWRFIFGEEEAKRRCEPQNMNFHGMGGRMARCSLQLTIVLVFSTCFPPIAIIGWVLFSLACATHMYLMIFVEDQLPDGGGQFWIEGLKSIFCALVIFICLMTGILLQHSTLQHAGVAVLALSVVLYYWRSISQLEWRTLPFESIAQKDDDNYEKTATVCDRGGCVGRRHRAREDGKRTDHYVQTECKPETDDVEKEITDLCQDDFFPAHLNDDDKPSL
jgi:hypothetical protein